jgi:MYXO-CTERM domain-containing protein
VVPSATGTEGSPSSDASPNDGGCACSAVGSQRTPAVALFSALSLLAAFSLWRRRARVWLG